MEQDLEWVGLAVDDPRVFRGWPDAWERSAARPGSDAFVPSVQSVFPEHRLGFRINEPAVVVLESETLHVEVGEGALRLVHRQGWEMVEKAHRDALGEIHKGKPENAVTEAAAALEEALEVRRAQGHSPGRQMDAAPRRGVSGAHGSPLSKAIEGVGAWAPVQPVVAANRVPSTRPLRPAPRMPG